MGDDCGLLITEQGLPLVDVAVLNTATILDMLAIVLGVYCAILDLTKRLLLFSSVPQPPLSHKINLPSSGRGRNVSFKCFPKATYTALWYIMEWYLRPVLLLHINKMGPLHWPLLLTCETLSLLQDTLQTLLECLWVSRWEENSEIQGPGIAKFCGVLWSGKTCTVRETVIAKVQPVQPIRMWKRSQLL